MSELSRRQLIGYLVVGAIVVAVGAMWARGGGRGPGVAVGAGDAGQTLGAGDAGGGDVGDAVGGSTAADGGAAGGGAAADGGAAGGGAGSSAPGDEPAGDAPIEVEGEPGGSGGANVVVHVAGAVRRPGVYRLPAGMRVDDAIRRAGGARKRADLDAVNLAAKVADGRQILVPTRAPPVASGTAGAASAGSAPAASAAPTARAVPINLNSATAEQLAELDGVGPVMAQKILEYRQEHGGFGSVDELDAVPGIGPKRMESLRDEVTA